MNLDFGFQSEPPYVGCYLWEGERLPPAATRSHYEPPARMFYITRSGKSWPTLPARERGRVGKAREKSSQALSEIALPPACR